MLCLLTKNHEIILTIQVYDAETMSRSDILDCKTAASSSRETMLRDW